LEGRGTRLEIKPQRVGVWKDPTNKNDLLKICRWVSRVGEGATKKKAGKDSWTS